MIRRLGEVASICSISSVTNAAFVSESTNPSADDCVSSDASNATDENAVSEGGASAVAPC